MDQGEQLSRIRHDVDRRNKTDMRLYPSMVVAVLLMYTAVAFSRGYLVGDDVEIQSFSIAVVGAGLVLSIMYVLATRVNKHNKRDANLMSDLCDFMEDIVPDGAENEYIMTMRQCVPKTGKQFALFIFFFATLFPAAFGALIYALGIGDDPDNLALVLITVSFVLGLLVILVNINFPHKHERRFIVFADATVDLFTSLGISMKGYRCVIGDRNAYLLAVLSIITFGVFIVIWVSITMRDFNRHIDEQWNFEDNLLAALKLAAPVVGPPAEPDC